MRTRSSAGTRGASLITIFYAVFLPLMPIVPSARRGLSLSPLRALYSTTRCSVAENHAENRHHVDDGGNSVRWSRHTRYHYAYHSTRQHRPTTRSHGARVPHNDNVGVDQTIPLRRHKEALGAHPRLSLSAGLPLRELSHQLSSLTTLLPFRIVGLHANCDLCLPTAPQLCADSEWLATQRAHGCSALASRERTTWRGTASRANSPNDTSLTKLKSVPSSTSVASAWNSDALRMVS